MSKQADAQQAKPPARAELSWKIGGGFGTVAAWGRPDMVLDAAAGIYSFTPANHIAAAGATICHVAGQDIHHLAQGNHATASTAGLVMFAHGKATNPDKPNQETGIKMHAASGSVSVQSQSGATRLTADKDVEVASTTGMVRIVGLESVLLAAMGAAIKIGDGITMTAPGNIEFRAGKKVFTSASTASLTHQAMAKPTDIGFDDQVVVTNVAGVAMANMRYQIRREDGGVLHGTTDAQGHLEKQHSFKGERLQIKVTGKS